MNLRLLSQILYLKRNFEKAAEIFTGDAIYVEQMERFKRLADVAFRCEVIIMKLEEAKVFYPMEWIAFRALEEGENPEGDLLAHNKDRRAFDKELLARKLTGVYITFSGPPVPEGYSLMF